MKCSEVVKWFVELDSDSYPKDVRRHIDNCDKCREDLENQLFSYRFLSIKRHATPPPGFARRSSTRIRRELYAGSTKDSLRFRLSDSKWYVRPLLQTAATAAVIVLAGSFFFDGGETGTYSALEGQAHAPPIELDLPLIGSTAPEWMAADTNIAPDEIQYGPLRSRLVDYQTGD